MRDAGWIQQLAQTPQEAHDLHLVAYRVAEDARVQLPVMVCVDGFVLTHAYEPVELVTTEQAAAFLPPYHPAHVLDPAEPLSFGTYADPSVYTEARHAVDDALRASVPVIAGALAAFGAATGRMYDAAADTYRTDDARVVLVAMGTAAQTARVVADEARDLGVAAGVLAIRRFRPFPREEIRRALGAAERVVVFDRSVSLGSGGIVATEIRDALYGVQSPEIVSVIRGLGGRDVTRETLARSLDAEADGWIDLKAGASR